MGKSKDASKLHLEKLLIKDYMEVVRVGAIQLKWLLVIVSYLEWSAWMLF
jgi:hypothetical protein